jgi:hypothetical protein
MNRLIALLAKSNIEIARNHAALNLSLLLCPVNRDKEFEFEILEGNRNYHEHKSASNQL